MVQVAGNQRCKKNSLSPSQMARRASWMAESAGGASQATATPHAAGTATAPLPQQDAYASQCCSAGRGDRSDPCGGSAGPPGVSGQGERASERQPGEGVHTVLGDRSGGMRATAVPPLCAPAPCCASMHLGRTSAPPAHPPCPLPFQLPSQVINASHVLILLAYSLCTAIPPALFLCCRGWYAQRRVPIVAGVRLAAAACLAVPVTIPDVAPASATAFVWLLVQSGHGLYCGLLSTGFVLPLK